jgi:hypothetical protein
MTVVDLVVQFVLGILLTAAVVRRDMRRLSPERYRRAWNVASFWSAIYAFGPLCIPVHFARTRRSLLGLLLGVLWTAGVLVAIGLVSDAVAWLTGTG